MEIKKSIGNAASVTTMLADNSVIVEIDGALRRIKLSDFTEAIQTGGLNLSQFAWGVPIKQNQSDNEWGRVGNIAMWEQYKQDIGRFLVSLDGTKMAKLSKTDSSIFADGTAVDETKGNVMFVGKDLYYLVRTDETTQTDTLWMSSLPIGGHVIKAPIFGAYKGSTDSNGKLYSRSGTRIDGSKSIRQFWANARKNGINYGLSNCEHRCYMMMLLLSEFGCPDCQKKIGYGVGGININISSWNYASSLLTGQTKSLGDACGKIDIEPYTTSYTDSDGVSHTETAEDPSHVSLFGIENAWNLQYEMLQGIYFGNSDNTGQTGKECFIYDGNRLPTDAELASHPNGSYRQIERKIGTDANYSTNGYVKHMVVGEYFDLIAKDLGGNTNAYWTDYYYCIAKGSENGEKVGQLCLVGGASSGGSRSGLGSARSDVRFSDSDSSCGVRLAYYGRKPEIVSGADL